MTNSNFGKSEQDNLIEEEYTLKENCNYKGEDLKKGTKIRLNFHQSKAMKKRSLI